MMGLFGYLHKCSPSALIVVLWESFYLSVTSCSRAMKSQKDLSDLAAAKTSRDLTKNLGLAEPERTSVQPRDNAGHL